MSLVTTLAILSGSLATGILGAMVGIGGGVLLVPFLILVMHVPIHNAIGASIVAVIATSSAAASAYVRDELTNMRLGMTLELATTTGAILGSITAAILSRQVLSGIFAVFLFITALSMLNRREEQTLVSATTTNPGRLGATYHDPYLKKDVTYAVHRLPLGMFVSFIAGNISGLLGIGGGVIKVPAMTLGMGVPMKAAAATSNFMIGVTAVASAYIYYAHGFVDPGITAPVAIGVFLGALTGTRLAKKVAGGVLAKVLAVVMIVLAIEMGLSVFGITIH